MGKRRIVDQTDDLIPDVRPANEKQILKVAKGLYHARVERVQAMQPFLEKEAKIRERLRKMIQEAGYTEIEDGLVKATITDADGQAWEVGLKTVDEKVIAKPKKVVPESDGDGAEEDDEG